jgi:two-component system chemotaxis sensor kinase CheA
MDTAIKNIFANIITSGKKLDLKNELTADAYIRHVCLNSIIGIGLLLFTAIGVSVFRSGDLILGILDFSMIVFVLTGFILLRTRVRFSVPALFILVPFMFLCVFLVIQGGNQGFNALWIYVFPPLAIFILELYLGMIFSMALLAMAGAAVFIPGIAAYNYGAASGFRLIIVYIVVFFFTAVYEQTRLTKDRRAAKYAAALQAERDGIAANLKAGLFIMDRQYIIQPLYSRALEEMLADTDLAGKDFTEFLSASVKPRERELVKDYLTMVFNRAFDQQILDDINPLHEFTYFSLKTGEERTLRCGFAPIDRQDGSIVILSTVQDITVERKLQKELLETENRRQEEMRALFEVIQVAPKVLGDFFEDMEYEFGRINDFLKNPKLSSRDALIEIYQSVHAIKSNAVILGLDSFSGKVHDLESKIKETQERKEIPFDQVLHLVVELEKIMREKDKFRGTVDKILSYRDGEVPKQDENVLVEYLVRASEKTALDLGKKVKLVVDRIDGASITYGPRQVMKEVLLQLVRNAVVHGIENPEDRAALRKDEAGILRLSIDVDSSYIHIKFQDDGRGLDFDKIRKKTEKLRVFKNGKVSSDKKHLVQAIFSPGFSTAENGDLYAGRGMGLSLVRDRIRGLHGSIRVVTNPGRGTAFYITIPLEAAEAADKTA